MIWEVPWVHAVRAALLAEGFWIDSFYGPPRCGGLRRYMQWAVHLRPGRFYTLTLAAQGGVPTAHKALPKKTYLAPDHLCLWCMFMILLPH